MKNLFNRDFAKKIVSNLEHAALLSGMDADDFITITTNEKNKHN